MALTNAEIQQVLDAIAALGKEVADLPDSSELVGDELVEVSQGGVSKKADLDSILALLGTLPTSGISTITPVITVGTGSCTDVTISFIRVGDRVHFQFYTRTLTIPVGEAAIQLTVDLTGTGFEPSTDFAGTGDVFGICRPANVINGPNEMASAAVESDGVSKKIKIGVGLTANASISPFSPAVTGSGSYSIL